MRQADLAGPRPLPAADEAGVRDGMVRRAERPVADQRHVARQHPGDGIDARHVQRLGGVMRGRIDGSERARSVLPEPGGPDIKMLWPPAAATSKARLVCS